MRTALLLLLIFGIAGSSALARDRHGRGYDRRDRRRPPPVIVTRPPALYMSGKHGTLIVTQPDRRRHPTVIVTRPRW